VIISYAGYYTVSIGFSNILKEIPMSAVIGSGVLIVSVLLIAFFSWLIRSIAESDYEPFLVHLTFFAFAGQLIRTAELSKEGNPNMPLVLSPLLSG